MARELPSPGNRVKRPCTGKGARGLVDRGSGSAAGEGEFTVGT